MASRLHEFYESEVVKGLMERFGYSNRMQVPKLVKVVLNVGVGEAVQNPKAIDGAVADLSKIAGQKPSIRRARRRRRICRWSMGRSSKAWSKKPANRASASPV